jgi:hypothetical protein
MTGVTARAGVRRRDQWCARCCGHLGGSSDQAGSVQAPLLRGRRGCGFLIVGARLPHCRRLWPRRGYRQGVRRRRQQLPTPGARARDRTHERPPCLPMVPGRRPYWSPAYPQKIWSTPKRLSKCFYPSRMAWLRQARGASSSLAGVTTTILSVGPAPWPAAKKKRNTWLVAMQSVVAICALWAAPSAS